MKRVLFLVVLTLCAVGALLSTGVASAAPDKERSRPVDFVVEDGHVARVLVGPVGIVIIGDPNGINKFCGTKSCH